MPKKQKKSPKKKVVKKTTKKVALKKKATKRAVVRKKAVKKVAKKKLSKKRVVKRVVKKKTVRRKSSKKTLQFDGIKKTRMKVIGIGGGGGNIVSEIAGRVPKIDFVAANTDSQALRLTSKKVSKFSFGNALTGGLGAGMDALIGEKAAQEEKERITKLLENQDVCILVASLGGGTGSGATPVFAEVAKGLKNLTLGVFTMPFEFEGEKRKKIAQDALEKLKPLVSAYVVIPNERIFELVDRTTSLDQSLSVVNRYLSEALGGLIETIYSPGLINIDFADLRSILEGRGRLAFLHSVKTQGQNKALEAARQILVNPLLDYRIDGVDRILFNIVSDKKLKMHEVAQVSRTISDKNPKAKIIFGVSVKNSNNNSFRITLLAVGCKEEQPIILKLKRKVKRKIIPKPEPIEEIKEEEKPKKKVKKRKKKKVSKQQKLPVPKKEPRRVRRNALDLKQAADKELEDMQESDRRFDVPAFLRNRGSE